MSFEVKFKDYTQESFEEMKNNIANKSVHYLCEASNSMDTYCGKYIHFISERDPLKKLHDKINVVNLKKESGTLYPYYYFSIFPTVKMEDIKPLLCDLIINANENYLRTKIIYIMTEKWHNPSQLAEIITQIRNENKETLFLREVYLLS
jgi:hypothetical protein